MESGTPPRKETRHEALSRGGKIGGAKNVANGTVIGGAKGPDPHIIGKLAGTKPNFPQVNNTLWDRGPSFKSFAQKIRHQTRDGWELVEAVYQVFQRARDAHADVLILESATWLADRGFGKPVQVGQLLDTEGNAVAFTLWAPAMQETSKDTITVQDGKLVDDSQIPYLPSGEEVPAPPISTVQDRDKFAYGPARPWGIGESE